MSLKNLSNSLTGHLKDFSEKITKKTIDLNNSFGGESISTIRDFEDQSKMEGISKDLQTTAMVVGSAVVAGALSADMLTTGSPSTATGMAVMGIAAYCGIVAKNAVPVLKKMSSLNEIDKVRDLVTKVSNTSINKDVLLSKGQAAVFRAEIANINRDYSTSIATSQSTQSTKDKISRFRKHSDDSLEYGS